MDKQEVIQAYCELSAEVAKAIFGNQQPADCFCGKTEAVLQRGWNYQYSPAVLDFIREAVRAKIGGKA